jgi:hypothetical protein
MPAKPFWFLRVSEITSELRQLTVPVVDRAIVEELFRLKRRQAIELMHRFGGYQAGRTFLIDRAHLIQRLQELASGAEFEFEVCRRERLGEYLEDMRRQRRAIQVRFPVAREAFSRKVRDLPDGVLLRPGRLEVDFKGTEDLLTKLFDLAQAASNDFERFESITGPK